ncbi:MAG: hypothetical protein KC591_16665, partial [Gemmatimonadetes bacterium]|nr:hypothetical protein [Gemmatimonadota bacterium]
RRPLVGAPWVQDLEDRMHALALDLARQEMARQQSAKDAKVRAGDEPSADSGPSDPGEDPLAP